jgi:ABC-type glutathione transport system ATPase component
MSDPVLKVSGLHLSYSGNNSSFSYPEFEVLPGECLSISGSTGCGKTSLLNALFQPSFPGKVEYKNALLSGKDIRSYGNQLYKVISYMPQFSQNGLNPMLTIEKQIQAVLTGNGVVILSSELDSLLIKMKLESRVLRLFPHQMSGGMKQRLVLLLSYLKKPSLMVLDEPTSAIDALTLKVILDFLQDVKGSGTSLLIVSHDTGFTRYIADNSIDLEMG